MFRRGSFFFLRAIAFLVLIGLLVGGGVMLYQSGQAQGYAMGLAASGKELATPQTVVPGAPAMPYYPGYYYPGYWRPHFFFPFAPLFGIFFLIVFFFVISRVFGALFWRRHAWGYGPGAGPWQGGLHGHGPHGWGPGPWGQGQPEQGPETPEAPAQPEKNEPGQ